MTTTNEALPEKKFTSYQVLVIILLALTMFTVVLDFMVMSPLGDMLMKSMSLTTSQFGTAVAGYALSAGASGLLTAGFADKFDRKKLLLFFYIGFIAGTLLCGLATSYFMLLSARIVTGIFGGVIGSISMAILADLFPLHQRGRAMGFMQMGFGASQVLGIPISLYIANHWGWQSPFIMIVCLAGIIWGFIMLKMHPVTQHLHLKNEKSPVTHLWHTLIKRDYRTGFLLTALLSLGGFMMMPWGSAFAVNNLHVSYKQLPSLFMASGIAALIIMPLVGKLSDKIDKVKIFTVAAISMMIIIVVYTNLKPIPFAFIVMLNIVMMTAIMSRVVPASALVSALPKMQDRGAFMSINSSLQQIAGGIAAYIGGRIVVQETKTSPLEHYDTLGYVIVVIILANIFQMFRVSNLIKKRKHTDQL
jgi:predicted MFS family arabinose efflux permease